MAGQGIFFKAPNFLNTCRILLNNRLPQFTQSSGIKQKFVDKLKELKVPEKPKKPLTPYFKFLQEHRDSIVKKHPDWKVTQITSQCAADWKEIDTCTKEKYEEEYKTEMEIYAKKYLSYTKNLTGEQKDALKEYRDEVKRSKIRREKRKKTREHDKPKRPIGAYMLFVMDQAKTHPGKNYMQLVSELKNVWAELPDSQKSKYLQATAAAQAQYEKDLFKWEQQMIEEGNLDLVRRHTLEKSTPKTKKNE